MRLQGSLAVLFLSLAPFCIHAADTTFRAPSAWLTSTPLIAPLPTPGHPIVAVKDPTVVHHDGNWHVYATTADGKGRWAMQYTHFADWKDAAQAKPVFLDQFAAFAGYNCAPQVFYFRPHNKWYLLAQSPMPRLWSTSDLSKPETWSSPLPLFKDTPKSVVQGWIDFWIICDDSHAYLFFSDDHGRFYRSRTTLRDFPSGFEEPVVVMQEPKAADLFEASCVYKLKGTDTYLCIIECMGGQNGHRYFRAFTSKRLDGEWTPLPGADSWAAPFAGPANMQAEDGSTPWADGVSHGEILRASADETMTIDPENLVLLYQGIPHGTKVANYGLLPYRLALLKADKDGKK